jgi:hypothetical protein
MRTIACWILAVLAPACLAAPPRDLSLEFVAVDSVTHTLPEGRAWVDIGRVASKHAAARLVVRQRVGVRVTGPYTTARISIALAADMPGVAVRVDGRPVSTVPQTVDPTHRLGTTVLHDVEFLIPADTPAGAFTGNLQWLAETN